MPSSLPGGAGRGWGDLRGAKAKAIAALGGIEAAWETIESREEPLRVGVKPLKDRFPVCQRAGLARGWIEVGTEVIGLARPGYAPGKDDLEEMHGGELVSMRHTISTLKDCGAATVISLSNRFYHANRDQRIKAIMDEVGFGPGAFEYIPNEDHVDNLRFREGMGPTKEKIERFLEIVKRRKALGKICVYCGAGEGRTYVYLSAYILSHYKVHSKHEARAAVDGAVDKIVSSAIHSSQRAIRQQMEENGGLKALCQFAEAHLS